MKYSINLETATWEATQAIYKIDKSFIGTEHYMGVGYFWHSDYKSYLRDASCSKRKRVHQKLLRAGLQVDGRSPAHAKIIADVLKLKVVIWWTKSP